MGNAVEPVDETQTRGALHSTHEENAPAPGGGPLNNR